ncbi:MAG: aldehyde ferredoxin oxidoreductase family protein [archaeon]|nr:aldehyde ferredoxin oxidoreductase family protein [archaeon]
MTQNYGYMGKILWVNLTTKEMTEEEPGEEIYRKYLGGYGLGIYYIYNRIKPGCDPLGPDNILGFCPGLLTGTPAPFTGRYMVCGKSPLTGKGTRSNGDICNGGWGDANSGGFFGPTIKRAGYDAIFFTGASDKPVYLLIDGDKKELADASDIWGKNTKEVEEILKERHGGRVASIGVAGENLSLISGIVNDKGRIAARSGLGAVMGSKKLKALCLNGNKKIAYMDKKSALAYAKKYRDRIKGAQKSWIIDKAGKYTNKGASIMRRLKIGITALSNDGKRGSEKIMVPLFHKYGTSSTTALSAESGDSPVKNYKGVGYLDFPQKYARDFSAVEFEKYKVKGYGCFGCPLQCGAILKIPELNIEETHRPEYETGASFGSLILNPDVLACLEANEYLNQQGVDTISAGGTIAFILECVENGLLKKEDFKCKEYPEGILPQWNTSEYIMPLLRMIVNREGIGDTLADGAWHASQKLGEESKQFAMCYNGQEGGMHDTRYMKGMAMSYLADPTPGRHTTASVEMASYGGYRKLITGLEFLDYGKLPEENGLAQAYYAKFWQSFCGVGFCLFMGYMDEYPFYDILKSIVSWEMTGSEFIEIGHRIQTLRQMFNAREGAIRHESPKRMLGSPPLEKGPLKGVTIPAEEMIQAYYKGMGFAENGIPLKETLEKLDLVKYIDDLPKCSGRQEPI